MGDYQPNGQENNEPILPEKWRGREKEIINRPESDEELEKLPIGTLLRCRGGEIREYQGSKEGGLNGKKVYMFNTATGQAWENLWPRSDELTQFLIDEDPKLRISN